MLHNWWLLCYDSKEDTLFMAIVLSLLRDSGELSLMNGDNNLAEINLLANLLASRHTARELLQPHTL